MIPVYKKTTLLYYFFALIYKAILTILHLEVCDTMSDKLFPNIMHKRYEF